MRDGSVTDRRACASCGRALPLADPRRRYCSAACRSRAHRRRQAAALPEAALARRPMAETVYECPACEGRLLGERRCSDCNLFCVQPVTTPIQRVRVPPWEMSDVPR